MAAKIEKVEVITIRPHIERQRRERNDRYYVHPDRLPYLLGKNWVKQVEQVVAEAQIEAEAGAKVEEERKVEEQERVEETEVDELLREWTISYSPEEYLRRYGENAKHSASAKAIIEKLAEE